MTNDAKLGLVIGVGLVILIAALFFKRDVASSRTAPESAVAAKPGTMPSPTVAHQSNVAGQKHVIVEGDTLFSLAKRYYNDPTRFVLIYQANREVLTGTRPAPTWDGAVYSHGGMKAGKRSLSEKMQAPSAIEISQVKSLQAIA